MQHNDGLSRDSLVCEDEATSVRADPVLEVLPMPQSVHSLVVTDLLQNVTGRFPGDVLELH